MTYNRDLSQWMHYSKIEGLEHFYLEDSYVIDINKTSDEIQFLLEVVLRENHPLYKSPPKTERYCYKKAMLIFPEVQKVILFKKSKIKNIDPDGTIDYGNIDTFQILKDASYSLSGDWGELTLYSDIPRIEILSNEFE